MRDTANGGMTIIVFLLKYAHRDYNPKLNYKCQPQLLSLMTCLSIHLQELKNPTSVFTLLEYGNKSSEELEHCVRRSS
jgi:hypothetical protein